MGWFRRRHAQAEPPAAPRSLSVDPYEQRIRAVLAGYPEQKEFEPEEAAELGERLRAIYDEARAAGSTGAFAAAGILNMLSSAAGHVRGKHYTDWVPTLDYLRSEKADDQAEALLLECIDGAERQARVAGREPAPAYTERLAIIYRRRKDYAAEIDIIERWDSACPPERRGPGATQGRLAKRLQQARELNG